MIMMMSLILIVNDGCSLIELHSIIVMLSHRPALTVTAVCAEKAAVARPRLSLASRPGSGPCHPDGACPDESLSVIMSCLSCPAQASS